MESLNALDLIFLGSIGLIALMGLKSGILKPASGTGGLVLGVVLAIRHHVELMPPMARYIDGEAIQRVAAFIAVALGVIILTKLTALLIKKLLSSPVLGWLDHAAGAMGGAAVGLVLVGTLIYLVSGMNIGSTQKMLGTSTLAPAIVKASIIPSSGPLCSPNQDDAEGCTNLKTFANDVLGIDVDKHFDGFLGGQDLGTLFGVVKSSLNGGSPEDLVRIASTTNSLE